MNLLTRILWRLIPDAERQMLLAQAPQYRRRHLERILKGRARYQPCFDQHSALFIHIPKSAGRSVVRGLFDVQSVEHAPADWYQQLDREKFNRYFKFTFVRNPWDRAVSAYSYLKKGGSKASEDDRYWCEFVNSFDSFDEFVCHWMSGENVMRNALFTPQVAYLKNIFGQVDMDFIGRFENLEEDFKTIASKLHIEAQLPHLNQSRIEEYQSLYTPSSQEVIRKVYSEDINTFGYTFNETDQGRDNGQA